MKKLLVINASPRVSRSHSRKLTNTFVESWNQYLPEGLIKFRDLAKSNIPHVTENWIAGAFKPESDRTDIEIESLRTSTELISELREADVIVIGTPMYNWSVPSSLKAYIDQVLRVNETWEVNPFDQQNPYIGLMKNKTVFLLLSRGAQGYGEGEYNAHMNFQSQYLKTVLNIIGITDIHEVALDGEAFNPEVFELNIKNTNDKINKLIENHLIDLFVPEACLKTEE